MENQIARIKTRTTGHLKIYIEPAHKVRTADRTLFRKIFPKSTYLHIIAEAKLSGIRSALAHRSHSSYSNQGDITSFSSEGDNSRLAMVVELIDDREVLESFFLKHKSLLEGKVVIYKEVEFWDES